MSDCSSVDRERELNLDRREIVYFYLIDELDIATLIEGSTRGTFRSDTWKKVASRKVNTAKLPSVGLRLNASESNPCWLSIVVHHFF